MKNKNYIRHVPYLRNSIAYNHDFGTLVISPGILFIFSKFVFWVKGQKMAQRDKKFCLLHFISQVRPSWSNGLVVNKVLDSQFRSPMFNRVAPRLTQSFILLRLIKWVPRISGNFLVKYKLPLQSCSSLEAVKPHP